MTLLQNSGITRTQIRLRTRLGKHYLKVSFKLKRHVWSFHSREILRADASKSFDRAEPENGSYERLGEKLGNLEAREPERCNFNRLINGSIDPWMYAARYCVTHSRRRVSHMALKLFLVVCTNPKTSPYNFTFMILKCIAILYNCKPCYPCAQTVQFQKCRI